MEEFYRRKYLSPSYKTPVYVETVQKDKTVAELRKDLQECKEMEDKFDDLCLEIVKLQRENKKIESEQSSIEGEYLQKIKKNKMKITELKQSILDCRENIELRSKKASALQRENFKLSAEVERIKAESLDCGQECAKLKEKIGMQEMLMGDMKEKVQKCRLEGVETKKENQMKSANLERDCQELKKRQLELKQEEMSCEQQRRQLQQLLRQKEEWQQRIKMSETTLLSAKYDLELQEKQCAKTKATFQEMQRQHESCVPANQRTKAEAKQCVTDNKQNAIRLAQQQTSLMEAAKTAAKDQSCLQKGRLREMQLKKGNERLQQVLRQVSEVLVQQQQSYNRIIGHMKHSIQQDEKAIESLSKQATVMEGMIS